MGSYLEGNSKLIIILISLNLFILAGCASSSQSTISITEKYSPEELKEDLNYLTKTDEQVHPNLFVHTPKIVFDSMIASVQNELNKPMTSFEFYKITAPLISKLRDGHTYLVFPYQVRQKYLDDGGKIIPMDIRIDRQKIIVRNNYSADSMLALNSEIFSINSINAQDILKSLRNYVFGEFESFQNYKIQYSFNPLMWTCYGFNGPFNINYISSIDKQYYTETLPGITRSKFDSLFQKGKNYERKSQKWAFEVLGNDEIALIDMNSFGISDDLDNFNKFLDSTFTVIKQQKIQNLIIDVRGNGGGETELTETLINYLANKPWNLFSKVDFKLSEQAKSDMIPWYIRWIPIKTFIHLFSFMYTSASIEKAEYDSVDNQLLHVYLKPGKLEDNPLRFKGNIYVLIDNGSFSALVIFAAVMKDYGFAKLIGEETGQSANPFGRQYLFNLPNTHLQASVPAGRSYRPSGLETLEGVIPDYIIKQNFNNSDNGRDTVMEFTKELISKNINAKVTH